MEAISRWSEAPIFGQFNKRKESQLPPGPLHTYTFPFENKYFLMLVHAIKSFNLRHFVVFIENGDFWTLSTWTETQLHRSSVDGWKRRFSKTLLPDASEVN